jgi:hypothetical protein
LKFIDHYFNFHAPALITGQMEGVPFIKPIFPKDFTRVRLFLFFIPPLFCKSDQNKYNCVILNKNPRIKEKQEKKWLNGRK